MSLVRLSPSSSSSLPAYWYYMFGLPPQTPGIRFWQKILYLTNKVEHFYISIVNDNAILILQEVIRLKLAKYLLFSFCHKSCHPSPQCCRDCFLLQKMSTRLLLLLLVVSRTRFSTENTVRQVPPADMFVK